MTWRYDDPESENLIAYALEEGSRRYVIATWKGKEHRWSINNYWNRRVECWQEVEAKPAAPQKEGW